MSLGALFLPDRRIPDENEIHGPDEPVYTIGIAAKLLRVTAQQLRTLERAHLVEPARTRKNIRLYSRNDLRLLRKICDLINERGVNIAGVKAILAIKAQHESEMEELKKEIPSTEKDVSLVP